MEVLAQKAGLSQSMISLVERDLRNPTLDTLLRMSEVLNVDLGEVISRSRRASLKKHGAP
jgi:transcriptional regulator with XRE-family HTH domain